MSYIQKFIGLGAFVIAFTLASGPLLAQKRPGRGLDAVAASKVINLRLSGSDTFVGTLQPLRKSIVGSAVDGRVVSIDINPGDPVTADPNAPSDSGKFVGQPVALLRTGTLAIEIESAEIKLQIAQQAFEELQTSLPKLIDLAEANAKVAEATLQYSEINFERLRRLTGMKNAVSKVELEEAKTDFNRDRELAHGARISFNRLSATREFQLAQSRLQVQSSQQEVKRLQDLKAKYTIRVPFEGLITQKLTDVGEWVTQGQPIVEVVQLDPIEMIINAPQEHLSRIQLSLAMSETGSPFLATIEVEGIRNKLKGRVKRIVAQADLLSRTFPVRIEIDNPTIGNGYALQPGMLGRATVDYGQENELNFVKKDALVFADEKSSVFKILKNKGKTTVVRVAVETGTSLNDWIEVKGDLSPQDQVVLLGNERLKSGQEVEVTQTDEELPQ